MATIDTKSLTRRVADELLFGPATVGAAAVAASGAVAVAAIDQSGGLWTAFAAGCALLATAATVVTRWIVSGDKISKNAAEQMQAEQFRKAQQKLDVLDARLRRDNDPRPEKYLRDLRILQSRLTGESPLAAAVGAVPTEIVLKSRELFEISVSVLQRTAELWELSQQLTTEAARTQALRRREQLIDEVRRSVEHLAMTLDGLQTLSINTEGDQQLARVREDLNQSLAVARRVEERLREMGMDPAADSRVRQ